MTKPIQHPRLEGLDLARFIAFFGMVIVNFKIVMGSEAVDAGWLVMFTGALEGRAAATFVVLAGIGMGLAAARGVYRKTLVITLKRAAFLLVIGLLNTLIFSADILHYYAFYFLFGVLLLRQSTTVLTLIIIALNIAFIGLLMLVDYETGWNWETFEYSGFWHPAGFIRNLFYNGWHPVIPWLGFFLFGLILSRQPLGRRQVQWLLVVLGGGVLALTEALSATLVTQLTPIDAELAMLFATSPIPPGPLYMLAGISVASLVTGTCLLLADGLARLGILRLLTPAGRQTLSLYFAHIFIGMGTLEVLGLLGGQTLQTSVIAAIVFCAASVVYALIWARFFKRGPVEYLMRKMAG